MSEKRGCGWHIFDFSVQCAAGAVIALIWYKQGYKNGVADEAARHVRPPVVEQMGPHEPGRGYFVLTATGQRIFIWRDAHTPASAKEGK